MRTKTVLALVVLMAVLLPGDSALARTRQKTKEFKLTMEIHYGVNNLQGTLSSSRDECRQDRKVDVFVDGRFVGRPISDEVGYWELEIEEEGSRYSSVVHELVFKQTKRYKYVCPSTVVSIP